MSECAAPGVEYSTTTIRAYVWFGEFREALVTRVIN